MNRTIIDHILKLTQRRVICTIRGVEKISIARVRKSVSFEISMLLPGTVA